MMKLNATGPCYSSPFREAIKLRPKPRDTVLDMNKSHITQAVYMHRPAHYPVMLQLTASNCSSRPVFTCYLPGPDKPTRAFDQFDQKQPKRQMNPHANFSTLWRWNGPLSSIHKWREFASRTLWVMAILFIFSNNYIRDSITQIIPVWDTGKNGSMYLQWIKEPRQCLIVTKFILLILLCHKLYIRLEKFPSSQSLLEAGPAPIDNLFKLQRLIDNNVCTSNSKRMFTLQLIVREHCLGYEV